MIVQMQNNVYESDEVRKKLADLMVSFSRFFDADTNTVEKMLNETELFLREMKRDYFPPLWVDVQKMMEGKQKDEQG